MDISDIRRANLLLLLNEAKRNRVTNKTFAIKVGLNPSYLSQVKSGERDMGETVARRIELGSGKNKGWLDKPHDGKSVDITFYNSNKGVKIKQWEATVMKDSEPHNLYPEQSVSESWLVENHFDQNDILSILVGDDAQAERIKRGDVVLVNTSDKALDPGSTVAILLNDACHLRRIVGNFDGSITLVSRNHSVAPDQKLSNSAARNLYVIGRVVRIIADPDN